MAEKNASTVQVTCPCCGSTLTVDPSLPAVLDYKQASKSQPAADIRNAAKFLKEEASRREEKYQQILEAEKTKGKVLDRKFQELLKKAKEEPVEKPLKDIDLD